ncbi:regulatory signaling modulator protein AmpE [Marinobacter sp.]|uniref:regulatory signaling modulator protein AmpE n=1 Tax=Marinobacter sp. TaxID=50741 RepID=UPI002B48A3D0|nr:regulatory signaling modulator protein AmpE [Marinobacter sp.]HKK57192.1 regulatory signaling modulator protein AmpE [Marinobacter sp.]
MEFVVFLAAYMVRRKLDNSGLMATDTFWRKSFSHAQSVAPGREASLARGLVIIAVPTLLLVVGEILLRDAGWSFAIHPVAFVLLFVLMGTPGLGGMLDLYIDAWRKGDMQSAWHQVCDFLPPADRGTASSPEQMHQALSRTVIGMIFERYFVIAFWYVVAGMGGAFAARALIALRDHWPHAAARTGFGRLVNGLNYLPSRLLGLTFGIAGDLAGWLKSGRSVVFSLSGNAWQTLMEVANSSLTGYELEPERFSSLHPQDWPDFGDRSLAAVRGLMNRSMLVWICALALLVIAGIV